MCIWIVLLHKYSLLTSGPISQPHILHCQWNLLNQVFCVHFIWNVNTFCVNSTSRMIDWTSLCYNFLTKGHIPIFLSKTQFPLASKQGCATVVKNIALMKCHLCLHLLSRNFFASTLWGERYHCWCLHNTKHFLLTWNLSYASWKYSVPSFSMMLLAVYAILLALLCSFRKWLMELEWGSFFADEAINCWSHSKLMCCVKYPADGAGFLPVPPSKILSDRL